MVGFEVLWIGMGGEMEVPYHYDVFLLRVLRSHVGSRNGRQRRLQGIRWYFIITSRGPSENKLNSASIFEESPEQSARRDRALA